MIRCRMARSSIDLALVAALDRFIFPDDKPVTLAGAYWWLLWDGDKAIGFGGVSYRPRYAFLRRAGVARDFRGKGLQRQLIRARVRYMRRLGSKFVLTFTVGDNLGSANNLVREGFSLYRPESLYAGRQALYFQLRLP